MGWSWRNGVVAAHRWRLALPVALWLAGGGAVGQGYQAQRFPDVIAVEVRAAGAEVFDFDVTVSSSYDTPARYADGFRVTTPSGGVLGERKLWHDHQTEQPFTRDLHGVRVPAALRTVIVQARDRQHGYGGRSVQVRLPGR